MKKVISTHYLGHISLEDLLDKLTNTPALSLYPIEVLGEKVFDGFSVSVEWENDEAENDDEMDQLRQNHDDGAVSPYGPCDPSDSRQFVRIVLLDKLRADAAKA